MEVRIPEYTPMRVMTRSEAFKKDDWTWEYYAIDAFHNRGWLGQGERIAVIDTGASPDHPDLVGRYYHIEDMRKGKNDPYDDDGHQTWIDGRIAAAHNSFGVKGISPTAQLVSLKALSQGAGKMHDIYDSLYRAKDLGCTFVNMSIGVPMHLPDFKKVVDDVTQDGQMILVAAAGNDGTFNDIDYPAAYPNVWAIGSHDEDGSPSAFTDRGIQFDILDAGGHVLSTYTNKGYAYLDGTSMAAPTFVSKLACIRQPMKERGLDMTISNIQKLVTCLPNNNTKV